MTTDTVPSTVLLLSQCVRRGVTVKGEVVIVGTWEEVLTLREGSYCGRRLESLTGVYIFHNILNYL